MKRDWKSRPRRRDYPWTDAEVDQLVEWGVLEFVPSSPERALRRLSIEDRHRAIEGHGARLPENIRKRLEDAVGELPYRLRRPPPDADLPRWMVDVLVECLPRTDDEDQVQRAYVFLAARLGFAVTAPLLRIVDSRGSWGNRRLDLSTQDQRELFLEWTELYEHLWTSTLWRDCLRMRYERGDRVALSCLSSAVRRRLHGHAGWLMRAKRAGRVSEEALAEAAARAADSKLKRAPDQFLRKEYLRAILDGGIGADHWLRKPISSSGFFERIAEPGFGFQDLHEKLQDTFNRRFCRYLSVPSDHPDALLGKILFLLLRLDWEVWERRPAIPPNLNGIEWPAWTPVDTDQAPGDYETISEAYSRALGIRRVVFHQIWGVYSQLTLHRYWQHWASARLTVYWAARLLEGLAPNVFRAYGQRIDDFHLNVLQPLMRMSAPERAANVQRGSPLDSFRRECIYDPLLNCIFHSEMFRGRTKLFPHARGNREDHRVRTIMVAYVVGRLRQEHPEIPEKPIGEVLPESLGLSRHVKWGLEPRNRVDSKNENRIGPFNHFTYAAPLVAAMIDDPTWSLSPEHTGEVFHSFKDDFEVLRLLGDPLYGPIPEGTIVLPPNRR